VNRVLQLTRHITVRAYQTITCILKEIWQIKKDKKGFNLVEVSHERIGKGRDLIGKLKQTGGNG